MSRINDFEWQKNNSNRSRRTSAGEDSYGLSQEHSSLRRPKKERRGVAFGWRLLGQSLLACVFFVAVVTFLPAESKMGEYARYVVGEGINIENSWLPYTQVVSVTALDTVPKFTVPASGVVHEMPLVGENQNEGSMAVTIETKAGEEIHAVADGTVFYIANINGAWRVEIKHSGGFMSVYSGMAEVTAVQGQAIASGETFAKMGDGTFIFGLWQNDIEQDPIQWLYNQ